VTKRGLIRGDGGDRSGIVLVFHDVGHHRTLERELFEQRTRLIEADHRKDEFVATLAHELTNLLASVHNAI
jgi:signal transduction histidine kinase